MAERQSHGFTFEADVIKKYGLATELNYTAKWDAYFKNTPVSIKMAKQNTEIGLGDIFRQMSVTQDFYFIVGFWSGTTDNLVEERILYIPKEIWISLFSEEFNFRFTNLLTEITNEHKDDGRWVQEITQLKKEWKLATNNLIRPRFKRDHKSQKRIQCAINYNDFQTYFCKYYEVSSIGRRD